jgi:hypothetical protein
MIHLVSHLGGDAFTGLAAGARCRDTLSPEFFPYIHYQLAWNKALFQHFTSGRAMTRSPYCVCSPVDTGFAGLQPAEDVLAAEAPAQHLLLST